MASATTPPTGEDLGAKLLRSVQEMKAARTARKTEVKISPVIHVRNLSGFSIQTAGKCKKP